jgi:acyl-CoA thioesterase FadM
LPNFETLEPAIDPNNKISFLLDWEMTLKCNLDCTYCPTDGPQISHDNSTEHPPVDGCLKTLDFMFAYVDMYMAHKPKALKEVVLNVYGGESLHHPDIVVILEQAHARHQAKYQDRWRLTVTTTTNAIVSPKKFAKIIPLIDEFTVSYHSENTLKHKEQFKTNLLAIRDSSRRMKCSVLMHTDPDLFADCEQMIVWLKENNIRHLPRQLDDHTNERWNYNKKQITWFNTMYQGRTHGQADKIPGGETLNLSDTGRACCGGRQVCQDGNFRERKFYVMDNKFTDWYCSVNWFFLHVKQLTGEIYINKDCRMKTDGTIGTIGTLSDTDAILNELKNQFDTNTLPIIQCKKYKCLCGLCAPKAQNLDTYKRIINKYQKETTQ